MFKNMKLGTKLLFSFLGVGVIPFAVVAIVSLINGSTALSRSAFDQLQAVQAIKKEQIEGYFNERSGDASVLSGCPTVMTALDDFKTAFEKDGKMVNGEIWKMVEAIYGSWMTQYVKEYGYYDLFIISEAGDVLYTVAKESDFGANLVSGNLRGSPLGDCFRKAKSEIGFADFKPYAPSNNEPAAFVGAPIRKEGRCMGVVALQLPLDKINNIMQQREGMGETGECYLIGPDKLMRSDSYLDPNNHSVVASFKNPSTGSVNTRASTDALSGRSGEEIIIDYNGNPVLSAFAPMTVGDITWAVIAEIDKAEAFASITALQWIIGIVALIAIAAIVTIALLITRSITWPINRIIDGLGSGSEQVAAASEQLSSSSQQMSEGASEQASSLEEVSSSLEEMASMTKQNADNAKQANNMATEVNTATEQSQDAMKRMIEAIEKIKSSSDETAKIIKTIDEIAMQTNLLALNAAVEAARAGEAGRGFAVVAEEVRNLAQRSAEAAKNTADLIEGSRKNSENGVAASEEVGNKLGEIAGRIEKVVQLVAEVSAASSEQSQGIDQVNTAVAEMDKVTQNNAANAEESASASEELSGQAQNLNAMVAELIVIIGQQGNGKNGIRHRSNSGISTPSAASVHQMFNHHGNRVEDNDGRRIAAHSKMERHSLIAATGHEVHPHQEIPLDDDVELNSF